jgi:hypothetical protein
MQQTTGVAVSATHLAQTDRRALSQAWYNALHLAAGARRPSAAAVPAARSASAATASAARPDRSGARGRDGGAAPPSRARTGARWNAARPAPSTGVPERRARNDAPPRRVERGLVRREAAAPVASFVVRAANGRVHLVVRSAAGATRVVAVCVPALRERVERALAQARCTLAGHGVRAEAAR